MSENKTFDDLESKEDNLVNNESADTNVEQKEEMRNITHLSGTVYDTLPLSDAVLISH